MANETSWTESSVYVRMQALKYAVEVLTDPALNKEDGTQVIPGIITIAKVFEKYIKEGK